VFIFTKAHGSAPWLNFVTTIAVIILKHALRKGFWILAAVGAVTILKIAGVTWESFLYTIYFVGAWLAKWGKEAVLMMLQPT
jgi:hypothetical protein